MDSHETTSTLPPPPRPIGPRAARRSWNESTVRLWLILLALVAATTAFFSFNRIREATRERAIIFRGEEVAARVSSIEGSIIANRREANVTGLLVDLTYTPAGQPEQQSVRGQLMPSDPPQVAVGDTLKVRVDPQNPRNWTARKQARPWTAELAMVLGLLPIVLLLVVAVLVARRRVLSVWRDGAEAEGVVIDARQSSIAPRSRIVRFVLADGSDPRVWTVLCPAALAPEPGHPIIVIHPPGDPGRAIAAESYV